MSNAPTTTETPTTETPTTETPNYTVPGLERQEGGEVAEILQLRLVALIDLSLTLKHIHWNVIGPTFISVHQMLDPQYAGVADMVDATAERIAALGASPSGLPGYLVRTRTWEDYPHQRAQVPVHLRELNVVYGGVVSSHRAAISAVSDLDPVTEDLLIGQTAILEQYQWFVRAHLESTDGNLHRSANGDGPASAAERIDATN